MEENKEIKQKNEIFMIISKNGRKMTLIKSNVFETI